MNTRLVAVLALAPAAAYGRDIVLRNDQVELASTKAPASGANFVLVPAAPSSNGAEPEKSLLIGYGGRTVDPERRRDLWAVRGVETGGGGIRLTTHTLTSITLTLQQSDGDWRIEQQFVLDAATVKRGVKLVWTGRDPVLLRWIDLRTPSQPATPGATLEAPGYPGILHQSLAELPMGQWPAPEDRPDRDAPAWRMGLFLTGAAERTVMVWPFHREIPTVVSVHRGPGGMWLNHRMFASCSLRPNESVMPALQYVRVAGPDVKQALRDFQPLG